MKPTTNKKPVTFTNKQLQMLTIDLLIGTICEIGDVATAHEWICPLFTASTPYSPIYPPLNHILAALELLDGDADENDASQTDKALAERIETMLQAEAKKREQEAKELRVYAPEPLPA